MAKKKARKGKSKPKTRPTSQLRDRFSYTADSIVVYNAAGQRLNPHTNQPMFPTTGNSK